MMRLLVIKEYSQLSDTKLNEMMARRLNHKQPKDYCNNPAHAWPIIDAYFDPITKVCHHLHSSLWRQAVVAQHENNLGTNKIRAAIIACLVVSNG